jgi:hypothetical protein
MTIKYFDLYSLNFSHLNFFLQNLNTLEPNDLQSQFLEAGRAETMKDTFGREAEMENLLMQVLNLQGNKETPADKMMQQAVRNTQEVRFHIEKILEEFQGSDPFKIQHLVNRVLDISQNEEVPCPIELRQQYFTRMKESGFLTPGPELLNWEEEKSVKYQPGALAVRFLEEHPEIKTLTIGCGESAKTYSASCYWRRADHHIENSFKIDLTSGIGPDLVVNMHNLDFWKGIPDGRFENIYDHTYGYFLLDDASSTNTISHIFRTLKPEGCLHMDHSFKDNHKTLLTQAGFIIAEGETQRIAKKAAI